MNSLATILLVLTVCAMSSGCYHATVTTGLTPGTQTIDQPWAKGWVMGLVPPETVDAASQCASGVAKVETQLSFLNQIVSGLTFGIFTPMHITVTCAASSADANSSISIPDGTHQDEVINILTDAADASAETGSSMYVHFE